MEERTESVEETEQEGTGQYLVDETPEQEPSVQQKRDHAPDGYTTGYDPDGDTRVGVGSAGGDVEKLIRHNEGRHRADGDHSTREAARDKKRVTQSFCARLGVTDYQQQEAVTAMGTLNLDRFGRQKRLEKVSLTVIKVIVEWERCHRLRRDSDLDQLDRDEFPDRMLDDETYCALLDDFGVSKKDVYSISQIVKRELNDRGHFGPQPSDEPEPQQGE